MTKPILVEPGSLPNSTLKRQPPSPTDMYDDFEPPPLVSRTTVVVIGIFLFLLATMWPPMLLVVTYLASLVIPYAYRVNDDAATRRTMLRKFYLEDPVSLARQKAFPHSKVDLKSSYWMNPRGLLLHTNIMKPKDQPISAVVCFCHGYADNPTYTKLNEYSYLVQKGLALIVVEYEGSGSSDGQLGLIKDWDSLVEDAHIFFQETLHTSFEDKKAFLMGESLGGAVAYTIMQKHSDLYAGVVFLCPMCKIADEMMPPQFVIDLCRKISGPTGTASLIGYLPMAPSKGDLQDLTFKLKDKQRVYMRHPAVFKRKPRFATAREMLDVTKRISEGLSKFEAPFLVQHGLADRVTDPLLSQALYDEAASKDKSIRLYEGMWHSLTGGEPPENVQKVFDDSIEWIWNELHRETRGRRCCR